MDVRFATADLADACQKHSIGGAKWGTSSERQVQLRLQQMSAAPTLADLIALPQLAAETVTMDGRAVLRLAVDDTFQMIIEPDHYSAPSDPGEVVAVTVRSIHRDREDTQ
jgi:plasmid maintenance system killer protein